MKFKGFISVTLVDYPGKVACTVFTYKCNFFCPYCHNKPLIYKPMYDSIPDIDENYIIEELKRRKKLINGLVITGGEPTLWGLDLVRFVRSVKEELDIAVKVDTNGSKPAVIKYLLDYVDYFAVDLKGLPDHYCNFAATSRVFDDVCLTLYLVKESGKDYEVRITAYPPFINKKTLPQLANILKDFDKVALQQCKKVSGAQYYTREELEELAKILENEGINVIRRF